MPLKKSLPNSLSNEQLIELLQTAPDALQAYALTNNDIIPFLSIYNIKPGKNLITRRLVYNLYSKWSPNPLLSRQFSRELSQYLLVHQKGPVQYYRLNIKAFKLKEEALKLIQQSSMDKTKSPRYKQHFENFLKYYNITSGNYWIPSYGLYYIYDMWSYKIRKNNPLGEIQFFNFCKLYFDYKRKSVSRVMFFRVSKNITQHITTTEIQQLREARYEKGSKNYQKKQESKE